MGLLDGKVAIVTGAGRGLGREEAIALARHGATVIVNDIGASLAGEGTDVSPAQEVVNTFKAAGGKAVTNGEDIGDWQGARRTVAQAYDQFGRLDILVNNAAAVLSSVRHVLTGDEQWFDEIIAVKAACGPAHLKVILETGELGSYDVVRRASEIAIAAGADFIKTSTGKIQPAATPPVTLVMLEAIRDHYYATGRRIGMKPAGGVRTAKQSLHYLVLVKETLGDAWLTPDLFRFGASALLNDVLMQLEKERTGAYQASDDFSKD